MAGRAAVAALAASFGILACAGCGGTREAKPADRLEWSQPNANNASTRAVHGPAAPATVDRLRVRWRFRLRGEPGFSGIDAATPVVSNGRIYLQDLNSDVYAVSLANGRLLWRHRYGRPDGGPNGVAVADGVVYGNTDTSAFALSARDGSRALADAADRAQRTPSRSRRSSRTALVYTSSTGQSPGGPGHALRPRRENRGGAVAVRHDRRSVALPSRGIWRRRLAATVGGCGRARLLGHSKSVSVGWLARAPERRHVPRPCAAHRLAPSPRRPDGRPALERSSDAARRPRLRLPTLTSPRRRTSSSVPARPVA